MVGNIAVIGATGVVGKELLKILQEDFLFSQFNFFLFASKSNEKELILHKKTYKIQEFNLENLKKNNYTFIFFCTPSSVSKKYIPQVLDNAKWIIDNSDAFREDNYPLVLPELNMPRDKNIKLITSPNCVVSIFLRGILPLIKAGKKIEHLVLSTYQAVSGAGIQAIKELEDQSLSYFKGEDLKKNFFPNPIAYNLFSHETLVNEDGVNKEEFKIQKEIRKILNQKDLPIDVTCIRVPIFRAHSISAYIRCSTNIEIEELLEDIKNDKGLVLKNQDHYFPMPVEATNQKEVYVGRIRYSAQNQKAINLFIVGDQLIKGAAYNIYQIASLLLKKDH